MRWNFFDGVNVHPLPETFYQWFLSNGKLHVEGIETEDSVIIGRYVPNKPVVMDQDNAASLYRDDEGWTVHRKRAWRRFLAQPTMIISNLRSQQAKSRGRKILSRRFALG